MQKLSRVFNEFHKPCFSQLKAISLRLSRTPNWQTEMCVYDAENPRGPANGA